MSQYLLTVGRLEPSYVIRKFLDSQRIHNLTSYLQALHHNGLAHSQHTTLLVNCYTKLQDVARVEAELMFAEYRADPGVAPPETSQRISNAITRAHDAVSAALAGKTQADVTALEARRSIVEQQSPCSLLAGYSFGSFVYVLRFFQDVLLAHLPDKLRELAGDRVTQRVPLPYQKEIVSCLLGSKIVYNEGPSTQPSVQFAIA